MPVRAKSKAKKGRAKPDPRRKQMAKTEKPPGAKAPAWMIGGARGYLPAIPPGESDDAPDGVPAAACTVQAVHEVHGLVVVLIDGDSEPTKVAIEDVEKLEGQLDDGKVVPFPGAASLEPADAEQVQTDPEPTEPPRVGVRSRSVERLRQRVAAAEAAAKRATAKFMNLARQLAELEREGS